MLAHGFARLRCNDCAFERLEARKLEKVLKRDVLCPVALDDAWKTCDWPGPLRRQTEDYEGLRLFYGQAKNAKS